MKPSCSIVIPAYNEEHRLPRTLQGLADTLGSLNLDVREVLVVNDGSRDATTAVAQQFARKLPGLRVLGGPRNFGKGHAVRLGLQGATQEWVLVADADMSTPWMELNKLAAWAQQAGAPIAIASRDVEGSNVTVHQSWVREHMGKTFNLIVRALTGLPFKDTQCGFKLLQRQALAPFVNTLRENRFAWDVEVLMQARALGLKVLEVPAEWEHRDESRVHPVKDALSMLWAVMKMRWRI